MSNGDGRWTFAEWIKFSWPILTALAGGGLWISIEITRINTLLEPGIPPPEIYRRLEQIENRLTGVESATTETRVNVAVILSILEEG